MDHTIAMNSKQRKRLLKLVADLGQRYPDWRFGQLICNAAEWADVEMWDIEDSQLLATLEEHLNQRSDSSRKPKSPRPAREPAAVPRS